MKTHETLKTYLQKNALPITVQLVGLIVVVANLWLVTKLAPLAQDVALVKQQVNAMDSTLQDRVSKLEVESWLKQFSRQLDTMQTQLNILTELHLK